MKLSQTAGWFQWTAYRKVLMGYPFGYVPDNVIVVRRDL